VRVAVGCCVYQDVEGVERLIESCYENIDYIFLIDGKYKLYEDDNPLPFSTDGLDELTEKYPNLIIRIKIGLSEHEKRQTYLDLCREFDIDFLIIADSDEYFYDCNWNKFRDELPYLEDYIYNIKNYQYVKGMDTIMPIDNPRLWRKPGLMEYKNNAHYQFGFRDGDVLVPQGAIYSIKLYHDPHLRSDERQQKHDDYIKKLEEYENIKQLWECNREKAQREYVVWSS